MVSTRGKKKAAANETHEENETAENVLVETQTSDSLTVNVEKPEEDAQLNKNVEIKVDEAQDEYNEEMSAKEESEKVTKVDNDDETTLVAEMNGDNKAESEHKTYENDEIDNQEDVMWDVEEEISEEDNEENFMDEDVVSLDEATEEEDDDEDEFSEEEATEEEEEGDDNNAQGDKEIAKQDAKKADEHSVEKVEPSLKKTKKSSERSRRKRVLAETLKKVSGDDDEDEVNEEEATEEGDKNNTQGDKEIAKDGRGAEEHNVEKVEISLKNIKKTSDRSRRKKVRAERSKKVDTRDKPESSRKRKVNKRVESMGMIFMCSSKTKNDCYQYRVFGLPESKKDIVEKIYTGMRLFLYDVDLKLMYGIYKAAGPGGYNIEPKAFKSQFPSQVRFTVLDDCLPLAEERFKKVIKENYFTNTKFDCQLNSEQVKKLCKLFVASSKGHLPKKLGWRRKAEKQPVRQERTIRRRPRDEKLLASREELRYHERPHKRQREVMSPVAPVRQPLPAPRPSTVPNYVYVRTSDANAYRQDPYLESHSPYRDRRDPLLNRPDPYKDVQDPYLERQYSYGDGRDPYVERRDPYRDARDPYLERVDPYRDGRDSYLERRDKEGRDPYRDGRESYLERGDREGRDAYRDGLDSYIERRDRDLRDPYIESRDPYRDKRDSYSEPRATYRDGTHSQLYSTYRRDPLPERRVVYVEDRGVEYPSSYRREEVLERRDPLPLNLETRRRDDIVSRDPYVSYRERPSYGQPIYSAEYPSRAGLVREYRL